MKRDLIVLAVIAMTLVSMAGAANYMYEKSSVKGVGYRSLEMVISTQSGFNGQKLVEKQSGSGNVITSRIELEAERQPADLNCPWPTGSNPMDYINFTSEQELEYMPVSYQTGTYDQKWVDKLCVQNYKIGAVLTEMYTHAEHLQKTTEVKTRGYNNQSDTTVLHRRTGGQFEQQRHRCCPHRLDLQGPNRGPAVERPPCRVRPQR